MNKEKVSNIFVYINKDIYVNGITLGKYSVGIIESKDKKESKIKFIEPNELTMVISITISNNDYEIFDPLKTGDLYSKKVCNRCHRLLDTKTFSKIKMAKAIDP